VAGKLDVTTLPASIRPKPQKNKKTFSDYGYVSQQMDGKKLLEATPEGSQNNIGILEQNESGIYVCVQAPDNARAALRRARAPAQSISIIRDRSRRRHSVADLPATFVPPRIFASNTFALFRSPPVSL
jgi:hypothetical protein